jgi:hypothetical protein
MDPMAMQYFAAIAAVLGIGELIYGVTLLRSAENPKKLLGCVMQGGGMGWLAAAAISYLARMFDWAFMAAIVAAIAGSGIGTLIGVRSFKAVGGAGK